MTTHNESVDAISPTPDIVSRFTKIGEDNPHRGRLLCSRGL